MQKKDCRSVGHFKKEIPVMTECHFVADPSESICISARRAAPERKSRVLRLSEKAIIY